MDMSEYLEQIRHAAEPLLISVFAEQKELSSLLEKRAVASKKMEEGYSRADFFALNPDLDDEGLGTQAYWDTYFGADKDQHNLGLAEEQQKNRIEVVSFSRAALSGTILQYAKQGLSVVHGSKENVPEGRKIKSQSLKEIIWQGRNHALHWEEGKPNKNVREAFDSLVKEDKQFAEYASENLSFEILELLEWLDWDKFSEDLMSLA